MIACLRWRQALTWKFQGQDREERMRRRWRRVVEEESEIVRNNWREIKATTGNIPLALLHGGPMLAEWSTRNFTDFAT